MSRRRSGTGAAPSPAACALHSSAHWRIKSRSSLSQASRSRFAAAAVFDGVLEASVSPNTSELSPVEQQQPAVGGRRHRLGAAEEVGRNARVPARGAGSGSSRFSCRFVS